MPRYNTGTVRTAPGAGVITAEPTPSGRTALGAAGYARDPKSELFLLAVANRVGKRAHHEDATARDSRFVKLVVEVALADGDWTARFLAWLRREATMRTASVVAGAEALHAREQAGLHDRTLNPRLISGVLQRGDEPGEMLAYWRTNFGRSMPKSFRAGMRDAIVHIYNQRSLLKWDTDSHALRFGDLVELFHPDPKTWTPGEGQRMGPADVDERRMELGALFRYAIDRRHGRHDRISDMLRIVRLNRDLAAMPRAERRAFVRDTGHAALVLRQAGFTWETLSSWLDGPMDAAAWSTAIQIMRYEARLKNLRNFDQAGVPEPILERVAAELSDPELVARAKLLPIRFLTAYRAVQGSLRWAFPLEKAINASLANVPALGGRTLILVDMSPSMFKVAGRLYAGDQRDEIELHDTAAVFGSALALRAADATLVQYGGESEVVPFTRGESLLALTGRFRMINYTETFKAMRRHYAGHDRVIVLTDEQTSGNAPRNGVFLFGQPPADPGPDPIPQNVPVYTWNLGGYKYGQLPTTRTRITFGGLSDAAFSMVDLVERGHTAKWPF